MKTVNGVSTFLSPPLRNGLNETVSNEEVYFIDARGIKPKLIKAFINLLHLLMASGGERNIHGSRLGVKAGSPTGKNKLGSDFFLEVIIHK
jgi:hypothetical protein